MIGREKEELILAFINGPLKNYLTGQISYGKFREEINEICGTKFSYSDIYPCYLFNAELHYKELPKFTIGDGRK